VNEPAKGGGALGGGTAALELVLRRGDGIYGAAARTVSCSVVASDRHRDVHVVPGTGGGVAQGVRPGRDGGIWQRLGADELLDECPGRWRQAMLSDGGYDFVARCAPSERQ
jgi:hypothetical protein